MSEIRFEPLPAEPETGHPLPRVRFHMSAAEALRSRTGEWALLRTAASHQAAKAAAYSISKGNLLAYRPAGHFEAAARMVDGEHRVYVRHVGAAIEGGTR